MNHKHNSYGTNQGVDTEDGQKDVQCLWLVVDGGTGNYFVTNNLRKDLLP